MKIPIFLLFAFALILLPTVSAATPDFVTTFGRNYTLSINIDVDGVVAVPETTQCNATIKDTLGRYINFQDNMSINAAGDAQILINSTALREIGQYPFKIACISGGLNQTVSGILETTSSGEDDPNNDYLILVLGTVAFIILGFGISTESYIFGFISGILFILTSVFVFQFGIFSAQNLYSQGIASVFLIIGIWCNLGAGYTVMEEIGASFS